MIENTQTYKSTKLNEAAAVKHRAKHGGEILYSRAAPSQPGEPAVGRGPRAPARRVGPPLEAAADQSPAPHRRFVFPSRAVQAA